MNSEKDRSVRNHVRYLLREGGAHLTADSVLDDFPIRLINARTPELPHTAWQLLEHMRIAQWDILRFTVDAKHVSPEFPYGYWPPEDSEATPGDWERSVAAFRSDLKRMQELVEDEANDLLAEIPHGTGQTLLREALLVADHNAYHLGALVLTKKILTAAEPAN